MTDLKQLSPEVFIASEDYFHLMRSDLHKLRQFALDSPRGRARICAHKQPDAIVHEMMIVLARQTYVRPHMHLGKSESLHLLEGELDFLLFDDAGRLEKHLELGAYSSGKAFSHHLNTPRYHSLIVRSEVAILHETTQGPFDAAETQMARWSPPDSAGADGLAWLKAFLPAGAS